ncbi:MAG: hypothetical protein HYZ49_06780 [Chloroflexi bacterium]|nr:hypothetical protein [Chloroflexota bacterium]
MPNLLGLAPRLLRALSQLFWALMRDAWEMMVWGNVRAGSISLADAPRSFRLLIRFGLWLTLLLCLALPLSDFWRALSPLQPLILYTNALAGLYVPILIVPVIIGLLALAWAYLLCGALHAQWVAKLAALLLFALFNFSFVLHLLSDVLLEIAITFGGLGLNLWSTLALLIQTGCWLALLALFVIRWRRPVRPGLEFPIVLGLIALMLFTSYFGIQLSGQALQSTSSSNALLLTEALDAILNFLVPYLVLGGVEMAGLGLTLTQAIAGRMKNAPEPGTGRARRLWIAGLAVVLVGRFIAQWIVPLFNGDEIAFSWGAVVIALLLLVIFVRAQRPSPPDELPWWIVPALALMLFAVFFVLQVNALIAQLFAVVAIAFNLNPDLIFGIFVRLTNAISLLPTETFAALFALFLGLAMWLWAAIKRRPFPGRALFLFVFSLWAFWGAVTRPGRPLGALSFRYEHFSTFMTLILTSIFVTAALARRLSPRRLLYLTAATILLWALEFRDFLADPLSPLFGLLGAGVAVVSVGIFLNVMSAGNRFSLNTEARSFPRQSRSLMYFGYALLVVITINWLAASHNADQMAQNNVVTNGGFQIIGLPLALWALITGSATMMGESARKEPDARDNLSPAV